MKIDSRAGNQDNKAMMPNARPSVNQDKNRNADGIGDPVVQSVSTLDLRILIAELFV